MQTAHRDPNGKKPAQRKSSGNGGTAATPSTAAAAAPASPSPRKSSSTSSTPVPRESTSIGVVAPAVVGADGSIQDVEQRVADVFVAFASSVAKVNFR